MEKGRETIAVFGGSFDPPHVVHVLVATYVLSVHAVNRVMVIPSFMHPLDKEARADFSHRMRMCELAFADLERAEVSPIEKELGGESRTLRTLEALAERFPHAALRFVMGRDLLGEVHRWHRFDRIAELAPPLVVGRSGYGAEDGIEFPAVSSTDIRERLTKGETLEHLLPASVRAYIAEHNLYGAA